MRGQALTSSPRALVLRAAPFVDVVTNASISLYSLLDDTQRLYRVVDGPRRSLFNTLLHGGDGERSRWRCWS